MNQNFSKTQKIRENYDETAEHYDVRYDSIQKTKYQALFSGINISGIIRMDKAGIFNLLNHEVILDLGCGTGILDDYLRQQFFNCRYLYCGIDISLEMLRRGKEKMNGNFATNYVQASMEIPPFRKYVSSLIISVTAFQNLDEEQRVHFIEHISEFLQDGGILLLSFLKKSISNDERMRLENTLKNDFNKVFFFKFSEKLEDVAFICRK
ncbi:MAG: class I SAM-dependent methyltransferase [Promethearchaeota archaeon]